MESILGETTVVCGTFTWSEKLTNIYLKKFLSYVIVLAFSTSIQLEYLKLYLLSKKKLNHLNMVESAYTIL